MTELSLIPGVRVSNAVSPELRIYSDEADLAEITVWDGLGSTLLARIPLEPGTLWTGKLSVADIQGNVTLQFQFYSADRPVHRNDYPYQVIPSGQPMTGLVDGCWLSLYHWSEEEGRYFNRDLKKLTHEDFARQVFDMDRVGIRGSRCKICSILRHMSKTPSHRPALLIREELSTPPGCIREECPSPRKIPWRRC